MDVISHYTHSAAVREVVEEWFDVDAERNVHPKEEMLGEFENWVEAFAQDYQDGSVKGTLLTYLIDTDQGAAGLDIPSGFTIDYLSENGKLRSLDLGFVSDFWLSLIDVLFNADNGFSDIASIDEYLKLCRLISSVMERGGKLDSFFSGVLPNVNNCPSKETVKRFLKERIEDMIDKVEFELEYPSTTGVGKRVIENIKLYWYTLGELDGAYSFIDLLKNNVDNKTSLMVNKKKRLILKSDEWRELGQSIDEAYRSLASNGWKEPTIFEEMERKRVEYFGHLLSEEQLSKLTSRAIDGKYRRWKRKRGIS